MNVRRFDVLIYLLLLVALIAGGSTACSTTKINAQNPDNNRTEAMRTERADSSTSDYKPPKRISKDVIKTDEKTEKANKPKQK